VRLGRQLVIAGLPPVADHRPDDQPFDEEEDDRRDREHDRVERVDRTSLTGNGRRRKEAPDELLPVQDDEADEHDEDSDSEDSGDDRSG